MEVESLRRWTSIIRLTCTVHIDARDLQRIVDILLILSSMQKVECKNTCEFQCSAAEVFFGTQPINYGLPCTRLLTYSIYVYILCIFAYFAVIYI